MSLCVHPQVYKNSSYEIFKPPNFILIYHIRPHDAMIALFRHTGAEALIALNK